MNANRDAIAASIQSEFRILFPSGEELVADPDVLQHSKLQEFPSLRALIETELLP